MMAEPFGGNHRVMHFKSNRWPAGKTVRGIVCLHTIIDQSDPRKNHFILNWPS